MVAVMVVVASSAHADGPAGAALSVIVFSARRSPMTGSLKFASAPAHDAGVEQTVAAISTPRQ
jgi:hypothetical protein